MTTTNLWSGIIGALNGHLDTMSGVPTIDGNKQIAWNNVKFVPTVGTIYIAADVLPGRTVAASIGVDGTNRPIGVYRVQVFAPANSGTLDAMSMADTIADHFNRGQVLEYNGIKVHITTSDISPISRTNVPLSSEVYFSVSVNINWFSYGEV